MELGFKAQGPVLLRKVFRAEGRAETKAERYSSAGSIRERTPGREERPGCRSGHVPISSQPVFFSPQPGLSLEGRVEGSLLSPPRGDPWVQAGAGVSGQVGALGVAKSPASGPRLSVSGQMKSA